LYANDEEVEMSVHMTFRARGDVAELERRAAAAPEQMQALTRSALAHGLISHCFLGTDDGDIMVLDEWESPEGFEAFFAENPQIRALMAEVGVSEEPEIRFWRTLEVHDEVASPATVSPEHERLVRRFFEEFCTARRYELASELVTEDYVSHGPQAPPAHGPDGLIERVRIYQEALEGRWIIEEIAGAGDRVVVRWRGEGRHVGELMGIAPTDRAIDVEAISVLRIAGGRVAEEWTVWDALGLLQQLGAVPVAA
jgi:predicted ester cyclase